MKHVRALALYLEMNLSSHNFSSDVDEILLYLEEGGNSQCPKAPQKLRKLYLYCNTWLDNNKILVEVLDVNLNIDVIVSYLYICSINAVKDSSDSPHH